MNKDISNCMNKYIIAEIQDSDIVREFMRCNDAKSVAKQFDMNTNTVKAILRKAGINVGPVKTKKETELEKIGMNERDFYEEK